MMTAAQTEKQRLDVDTTGGVSSDPHGQEDFLNAHQMFDPSLVGSFTGTGRLGKKVASDTDMHSAVYSY